MFKSLFISGILIFGLNTSFAYPTRPNPVETQGELCNQKDPDFSELRYKEKIAYCRRNVDFAKRKEIYDAYRIPNECRHRFTVDHFIPLAIGGSNDDTNLWPEHKLVKATRPNLEIDLYNSIKDGKITQAKAIKVIVQEKMKAFTQLAEHLKKNNSDNPEATCDIIESY